MTFEEFDVFTDKILKQVLKMRDTKGREYAGDLSDRFGNFDRLSKKLNISKEIILYVYLTKHLDSIETYLKIGVEMSEEKIQGRIVDAITYLLLLAGMLEENKA